MTIAMSFYHHCFWHCVLLVLLTRAARVRSATLSADPSSERVSAPCLEDTYLTYVSVQLLMELQPYRLPAAIRHTRVRKAPTGRTRTGNVGPEQHRAVCYMIY